MNVPFSFVITCDNLLPCPRHLLSLYASYSCSVHTHIFVDAGNQRRGQVILHRLIQRTYSRKRTHSWTRARATSAADRSSCTIRADACEAAASASACMGESPWANVVCVCVCVCVCVLICVCVCMCGVCVCMCVCPSGAV